ncbi:MAG TPA: DsbC family protein [Steroidobacteraceae bacterium]
MVANRFVVWLALCGAAAGTAAPAQQPAAQPNVDPRAEIASHIPGSRPEQLRASPIQGIYEFTRGAEIAYVTSDGKYAIAGDLYDLGANDDLTEARRREVRMHLMAAVPESDMVIFGPKDPKYTVTIFTDVDCGYCRKLHSQIAEYNRLGVRVRYLLYPRTGPNTSSWTKAEQVWCSADHNDALTRAKLGQELQSKPCANNPVARSYALGRDFALDGTPAIVMANGELLPGYVPPDVLAKHLKDGPGK